MEYIDSNYLCYMLTENREFADLADAYFAEVAYGERECASSIYLVTEVVITLNKWFKWPLDRTLKVMDTLLTKSNIKFLPLDEEVMRMVPEFMSAGLGHGDSIHAATMKCHNITTIISADKDFDRVPGIKREPLK